LERASEDLGFTSIGMLEKAVTYGKPEVSATISLDFMSIVRNESNLIAIFSYHMSICWVE
jgi:hypothetical protein